MNWFPDCSTPGPVYDNQIISIAMFSITNVPQYFIITIPVITNIISAPIIGTLTHPLKQKCCHFDEILITDCTESCHFDNFRCSQWLKFRQNDDISVSVSRRDEMTAISPTIYSDAFSWTKSFVIWLKLHWSLSLRVWLTTTEHWFR